MKEIHKKQAAHFVEKNSTHVVIVTETTQFSSCCVNVRVAEVAEKHRHRRRC